MNNDKLNEKIIDNIVFDDGFKEIKINGDDNRIVRWNPSDINFVDRFIDFQQWVSGPELANKLKDIEGSKFSQDSDGELAIEGYNKDEITNLGIYINNVIDKTFGKGFSEAAFLGANPLTPTATGGFIFTNFIEALSPVIIKSFEANSKAANKYSKQANKLKENRE